MFILGDGMLGKQLLKEYNCSYISRKKDNIDFSTQIEKYFDKIKESKANTIINCIANTNTYGGTEDEHFIPNYYRVIDLVKFCNVEKIKLVHISSDYVYSDSVENAKEDDELKPIDTHYGISKMMSDKYVQAHSKDYTIIRTSFKPNPFPYDKVVEQVGNFDYVDVIAKLIFSLLSRNVSGVYNVGTNKKTMYQLASKTKSNLGFREPIHEKMPKDISMDVKKMENVLYGV